MPSSSPPPQPASVERAQAALQDFRARQAAGRGAAQGSSDLPQQPLFTVTPRPSHQASSSAASPKLPGPRILPAPNVQGDGLLPRTRAQLPTWYLTLRQVGSQSAAVVISCCCISASGCPAGL